MKNINLFVLAFSVFAGFTSHAQRPNNNQPYFPFQNGEEIIAGTLSVHDKEKIINCEIGLMDGPGNVDTKAGRISFKRYLGDSKFLSVEFAPPKAQRTIFEELGELSRLIELPPTMHTKFKSRGFVVYGFRIDDHQDRTTAWPASAYEGNILMELGGYLRVSSERDENKRAAVIIHSLCETARVRFNNRYPELSVRTLRPEGEEVREDRRDEQRAYDRIPTWRRLYNKVRNYL